MKILTISTSSPTTYFTLFELSITPSKETDLKEIHENLTIVDQETNTSYSIVENLSSLYDKIMKNNKFDLLIIDKGPGSFTGIRTGIAFAKGLTVSSTIPLRTVSILDSLALQKYLSKKDQQITAQIDARNGNVYSTTVKFDNTSKPTLDSRNQLKFIKATTFDPVNNDTIKSLTTLGVFDYLQYGVERTEAILPLYGNPVNISKPINDKT